MPVIVCDNNGWTSNCGHGKTHIFTRANYGRTNSKYCPQQGLSNVNCLHPNAIQTLHKLCLKKRKCNIWASSNNWGSMCPGTARYLEFEYACVSGTYYLYYMCIIYVILILHVFGLILHVSQVCITVFILYCTSYVILILHVFGLILHVSQVCITVLILYFTSYAILILHVFGLILHSFDLYCIHFDLYCMHFDLYYRDIDYIALFPLILHVF